MPFLCAQTFAIIIDFECTQSRRKRSKSNSKSMGGKYEDTMAHQSEDGKVPLKDAR